MRTQKHVWVSISEEEKHKFLSCRSNVDLGHCN